MTTEALGGALIRTDEEVGQLLEENKRLRESCKRLTAALDEASRGVHKPEHLDVLREGRKWSA